MNYAQLSQASQRITEAFATARAQNRAALIPFIMGYHPDPATTSALLDALPAAGADMIEIGIPFSDPMADGPIIEAAGKHALSQGATLAGILGLAHGFRKKNPKVPVILMGYYNPIYHYGAEKFCHDAQEAGVDGIIIVDLPPEEDAEIRPYLHKNGLNLIRLIAPTSGGDRLPVLTGSASGFVYYISVTGITGGKSADNKALKAQLSQVREFTTLPVAVGFGIKTAAQVRDVAAFADGVVVGSALVDVIAKAGGRDDTVKAATQFVGKLAEGLKR